jgi:hypothetical protein
MLAQSVGFSHDLEKHKLQRISTGRCASVLGALYCR